MICKKCNTKMHFFHGSAFKFEVHHYLCPKCKNRIQFCGGKWQNPKDYFINDEARIAFERKVLLGH